MTSLPPDKPSPPSDKTTVVPAVTTDFVQPETPAQTSRETTATDPRDVVTPEAFFVAPQLLGKPLAKPKARGMAWAVDGAVVAVLSQSGNFLLALALAVLSYQLINKHQPNAVLNALPARARRLPALMMVVCIGWAALIGLQWLGDAADTESEAKTESSVAAPATTLLDPSLTPQQRELAELRAEYDALKAAKAEKGSFSLLETAGRVLDDIGFGFGWAAVYFSLIGLLWPGQTVGKKMFGLRVVQLNGKPLSVWDSFNRYGGYAAGFATGLLGFAQVFWDANRQAIHDKIAFTVVVDENRS